MAQKLPALNELAPLYALGAGARPRPHRRDNAAVKSERHAGPPQQSWNVRTYAENGRFVSDLGVAIVDLLAPKRGERILDLGCGDGVLTARLVARGAEVVGVDSSPELIAAARDAGIDARPISGEAMTFAAEFDAVFTNAALHWMRDVDAVLGGVARALKPGGRFVGEFGGHGNVAAIRTALRAVLSRRNLAVPDDVWYFPTAPAFAAKLRDHGFSVERCVLVARPTPLPTGLHGWLTTFAQPFFQGAPSAERETILDEVTQLLAPALRDEAERWTADYVRLQFAAKRPNR